MALPNPVLVLEDGSGIPGANSYIAVADADIYFAGQIYPGAWATATDNMKIAALMTATRTLDSLMAWNGRITLPGQALGFPRYGIPFPVGHAGGYNSAAWRYGGGLAGCGPMYPVDQIPPELKAATCEMAKLLMAGDRTAPADTEGIASLGLGQGAIDIAFTGKSKPAAITGEVLQLLSALGRPKSGGGMVPVSRG